MKKETHDLILHFLKQSHNELRRAADPPLSATFPATLQCLNMLDDMAMKLRAHQEAREKGKPPPQFVSVKPIVISGLGIPRRN